MVTSWFWLVGAVVLSLLPPLVRTSSAGPRRWSRSPGHLLGRDRDRLRPRRLARRRAHRSGADADRRRPARPVLARSRLDASAIVRASTDGIGEILPRPAAFTSRSTSPASPSRAACSSCRPSRQCRPGPAPTSAPGDRRRQCAQRRLHSGRPRGRAPAERATGRGDLFPDLASPPRGRRGDRPTMPTSCCAIFSPSSSALFRLEVTGLEPRQGGPQRHHRPQSCELPRPAGLAGAPAQGRSSPSISRSRSNVGPAVPRAHPRDAVDRSSRWRPAPSSMPYGRRC